MFSSNENSIVRTELEQPNRNGQLERYYGTGFLVAKCPNFCLIMSCGHNFLDYNEAKDSIYVSSGEDRFRAHKVFIDEDNEVSIIRVDEEEDSKQFVKILQCPVVIWSDVEASTEDRIVPGLLH